MSDHYFGTIVKKARKTHRCDWCLECIHKGELYLWGSGVYDGSMYTSKFHNECLDDFWSSGEDEFSPGDGERPEWRFTDFGLREFYTLRGFNLKKLEKYVRPVLTFDYL